jgi:hypothetical protein
MRLRAQYSRFDGITILENSQQREDTALREIGMLKDTPRLANDIAKLKHRWLKMWLDTLASGSVQCAEQLVVPDGLVFLRFCHRCILFAHGRVSKARYTPCRRSVVHTTDTTSDCVAGTVWIGSSASLERRGGDD